MQQVSLGFIMGILGSIHCIGMCGPLVMSIFRNGHDKPIFSQTFYHIGKIASYLALGLVFGGIGKTFHLFLSQQKLSILIGLSFLIYFLIQRILGLKIFQKGTSLLARLNQFFSNFRMKNSFTKFFLIGVGNGFLPCGLVYTAAITASSYGHIQDSLFFMLGFGLGTIPSLTSVVYIFKFIPERLKPLLNRIYQYLIVLIGILLILRGLNLGIPYISPNYDKEKTEVKGCCHKY